MHGNSWNKNLFYLCLPTQGPVNTQSSSKTVIFKDHGNSIIASQLSYGLVKFWRDHYLFARTCSYLGSRAQRHYICPKQLASFRGRTWRRRETRTSLLSPVAFYQPGCCWKKVIAIPFGAWLQDTTPHHQGGLAKVCHRAVIMSQGGKD